MNRIRPRRSVQNNITMVDQEVVGMMMVVVVVVMMMMMVWKTKAKNNGDLVGTFLCLPPFSLCFISTLKFN